MKIKAVEMMRKIRNKVDLEIKDLSWQEESEYLKQHNQSFTYLTQRTPNKALHLTAKAAGDFERSGCIKTKK